MQLIPTRIDSLLLFLHSALWKDNLQKFHTERDTQGYGRTSNKQFEGVWVKTQGCPLYGPYIFTNHPHGIIGVAPMTNFGTSVSGFTDLFPDIQVHLLGATAIFRIPLFREWCREAQTTLERHTFYIVLMPLLFLLHLSVPAGPKTNKYVSNSALLRTTAPHI